MEGGISNCHDPPIALSLSRLDGPQFLSPSDRPKVAGLFLPSWCYVAMQDVADLA